jgi:sugar phosphate isomerase/epimerase
MPDVSLSTMWMRGRFERPRDFLLAGVQMGFRSFELTAIAGPALYEDVHPGEFNILSLHDPAPGAMDAGDLRRNGIFMTSLDEEQRRLAVDGAVRSVDVAGRYGARAIILHLGCSEADPALPAQLERLYAEGRIDSREASEYRSLLAYQRDVNHDRHMAALMRSLDELIPYAAARGIRLGLENRRHAHETPNFEELEWLLSHYVDDAIGYWHDVGHAQAQADLGMTAHVDWLHAFGPRLVGMHLHDLIGMTDHRAPGSGCVDWEGLACFVPQHGLRTAEIKSDIDEAGVCAGIEHLASLGWIQA